LIEDYNAGASNPTNNPNYHSPRDTIDTLNFELCTQITRVGAAAVVDLALAATP